MQLNPLLLPSGTSPTASLALFSVYIYQGNADGCGPRELSSWYFWWESDDKHRVQCAHNSTPIRETERRRDGCRGGREQEDAQGCGRCQVLDTPLVRRQIMGEGTVWEEGERGTAGHSDVTWLQRFLCQDLRL